MHFAKTAYVGEKSGSQVMAKNVLGKSDFSEKNSHLGQVGHFRPQNGTCS